MADRTSKEEKLYKTIEHLRRKIRVLKSENSIQTDNTSKGKIIDSVLNTLPYSALILNNDKEIIHLNEIAAQIICMNFDNIIGRKIDDFFQNESSKFINSKIEEVINTRMPVNFEDERDQRIFDISIYPIIEKNAEDTKIAFFAQDITKEKKVQESEYKKSLQLKQLLKTAHHLTSSLNLTDVLEKICQAAKKILHSYGSTIYLLEDDEKTLVPKVVIDPIYKEEVLSTNIEVNNSFTGKAIKTKKTLVFNNTTEDNNGYQIPGTSVLSNERIIVTPLIVEGKILGALTLNRIGPIFTDDDRALAETFGLYASTSLKNAQTFQKLQKEINIRKRTENNLHKHREHLKLINRILRHDIINNLSTISSAIRLYQEKKSEHYLEKINSNVHKSIELIKKMKDLESVLSTSHANLKKVRIDKLIKEITRDYPSINFEISGQAEVIVDDSIESAFENLISNSKIHGKAKNIKIQIKNLENKTRIKLSDDGCGIPDTIKSEIFDEGFKYGETAHTGLGLYIVRKTIETLGGEIHVKDNQPKGVTFIIYLNTN